MQLEPHTFWPDGHWQAPALQSCPETVHGKQLLPPEPQAEVEFPGRQLAPEQQPFVHELALQTQTPATHCCPLPHGVPVPQRQPPLVQLSATKALQVTQLTPPTPQLEKPELLQLFDAQQPPGEEVALH